MNESLESQLVVGKTATEVVRIDNTVRRSVGSNSEFSHAVLKLLEAKGYGHAPRFLGIDEKGREILTFMAGEVHHGEMNWTDAQLIKVVQMLKDFHDATAGSELTEGSEVVCHNDVAPWNTILENEVPIAFIDFDDVSPGNRADDLAYMIWTFLELGSEVSGSVQAKRIQTISEGYGFSDRRKLIDAVLEQQERILAKREQLAKDAPDQEAREFSACRLDIIRSEIGWVKANRNILEGGSLGLKTSERLPNSRLSQS